MSFIIWLVVALATRYLLIPLILQLIHSSLKIRIKEIGFLSISNVDFIGKHTGRIQVAKIYPEYQKSAWNPFALTIVFQGISMNYDTIHEEIVCKSRMPSRPASRHGSPLLKRLSRASATFINSESSLKQNIHNSFKLSPLHLTGPLKKVLRMFKFSLFVFFIKCFHVKLVDFRLNITEKSKLLGFATVKTVEISVGDDQFDFEEEGGSADYSRDNLHLKLDASLMSFIDCTSDDEYVLALSETLNSKFIHGMTLINGRVFDPQLVITLVGLQLDLSRIKNWKEQFAASLKKSPSANQDNQLILEHLEAKTLRFLSTFLTLKPFFSIELVDAMATFILNPGVSNSDTVSAIWSLDNLIVAGSSLSRDDSRGRVMSSFEMSSKIQNISLDLVGLSLPDKAKDTISLPLMETVLEVCFNQDLDLNTTGPSVWAETQLQIFIESLHINSTDKNLSILMNILGARPRHPPFQSKYSSNFIALMKHFAPIVHIQGSVCSLNLELTRYSPEYQTNASALISLGCAEFNSSVALNDKHASEAFKTPKSSLKASDTVLLINLDMSTVFVDAHNGTIANQLADRLVLLSSLTCQNVVQLSSKATDLAVPSHSSFVIASTSNFSLTRLTLNLEPFANSELIDYFALFVALSVISLPLNTIQHVPTHTVTVSQLPLVLNGTLDQVSVKFLAESKTHGMNVQLGGCRINFSQNNDQRKSELLFETFEFLSNSVDSENSSKFEEVLLSVKEVQLTHVKPSAIQSISESTLDVNIMQFHLQYTIRSAFAVVTTVAYMHKILHLLFRQSVQPQTPNQQCDKFGAQASTKISILKPTISALLDENVDLKMEFDPIRANATVGSNWTVECSKLALCTNFNESSDILTVLNLHSTEISPNMYHVQMNKAIFFIPYGFELANIVENSSNNAKAIKQLLQTHLGHLRTPANHAFHQQSYRNIAQFLFTLDEFVMDVEDEAFESSLLQNFIDGNAEQILRLSRLNAFDKKLEELKQQPSHTQGLFQDARRSLLEFNSKSWLERVQKRHQSHHPSIARVRLVQLELRILPPVLLAPTVQETLHILDPLTPKRAQYNDLLSRNLDFKCSQVKITLRQIDLPLLYVPPASNYTHKAVHWSGLFVVAEQSSNEESLRKCCLNLSPIRNQPLIVERVVNPTKIYAQSTIVVNSGQPVRFSWGTAIEPYMADFVRVLDKFTKPTTDPSPPVGWWDKLRLIMHGNLTLCIKGDHGIRVRITGSQSPYFDARHDYGSQGVDFCFKRNVTANLGQLDATFLNEIMINAGQFLIIMPKSQSAADDEVLAELSGGVSVLFGIDYLTLNNTGQLEQPTPHSKIVLRDQAFAMPVSDSQEYDAFRGFKTKEIRISIIIKSPKPFYHELAETDNQLHFNPHILHVFRTIIPLYQSPVASILTRRGNLYSKENLDPKPKLSRYVGAVDLLVSIHPLRAAWIHPDGPGKSVGVRLKADSMVMDMKFVQKPFKVKNKKFEGELLRVATRWSLSSSEIDFTEMEARAVSIDQHSSHSTQEQQGYESWIMSIDKNVLASQFNAIPFVWTPKFVYFKKTEHHSHGFNRRQKLNAVQTGLLKDRLNQLDHLIGLFLEKQGKLQSKLGQSAYFRQESDKIIERLASLYIKKHSIQATIQTLSAVDGQSSADSDLHDDDAEGSTFDHHYLVYNINFLWKKSVRDIVLRLISLENMDAAVRYFLSSSANRLLKDLVSDPLKDQTIGPSNNSPRLTRKLNTQSGGKNVAFTANDARKLLEWLKMDTDNFAVACETDEPVESSPVHQEISVENLLSRSSSVKRIVSKGKTCYVASNDPKSSDFVRKEHSIWSDFIIELMYPQLNFETGIDDDDKFLGSFVIAAESMTFMSVDILDGDDLDYQLMSAQEINEHLLKNRSILTLENAQFLVATQTDVDSGNDTDVDPYNSSAKWPCWVPIECMIDPTSPTQVMQQIVKHTSASLHRDATNPLYLKRNHEQMENIDTATSFKVNFPRFVISVNSSQYSIIYQVITNLLVYRDPEETLLSERKSKMMLALSQTDDIPYLLDWVNSLQDKIRQSKALILAIRREQVDHQIQETEILDCLKRYRDELYVIMGSLRELYNQNQRKNSVDTDWKLSVHMERLVWLMLNPQQTKPFAQWTLSKTSFQWVQRVDLSSFNTLEINKVAVKNLIDSAVFKHMVSPYDLSDKPIDFDRQKMLRVYWSELPPVAGIQVVEHFEINFFPLKLQMTLDIAKMIVHYMFPEKKRSVEVANLAASSRNNEKINSLYSDQVDLSSSMTGRKYNKMNHELKEMQSRAVRNKSFIYIKVPGLEHCLSYKESKDKNFVDLYEFVFKMPTLEYRNKTWTWFDFLQQVKRDAMKAIIMANTASLVKEKLFSSSKKEAKSNNKPQEEAPTEVSSIQKKGGIKGLKDMFK